MQNITKAQVLALFLGSASAQVSIIQLLNGPGSVDTVPADQTLTTINSGTACNSNDDCTDPNERCGAFQRTDVSTENLCINANYCGSLGRLNSVPFAVQCWATPESGTATPPETVDPAAYMVAIEDLITEAAEEANWDGVENIWVSPKFQYQDGWYILNTDGKWVETNKLAEDRCFVNRQCEPTECCMSWPDSNNKRCGLLTLDKQSHTVGPVTFTPTCIVSDDDDVVPESAQADIAAGALAEASEKLGTFYDTLLDDKKTADGYASMTDAEKTAFDEAEAAAKAAREALWTELKETAGYNSAECDDDCKSVFEVDLLKWGQDVYQQCTQDKEGIACREAEAIKKAEEQARAGGDKNYYSGMTAAERTEFDAARVEEVARLESGLAAAWIRDNKPAAGAEGSACAEDKCTKDTMCCGTSKPKAGNTGSELTKICVTSTDKKTGTYTDGLGRGYDHTCATGARYLSAAAAFATAAYALM